MSRLIDHPLFEFAVACAVASLLGGAAMYFGGTIVGSSAIDSSKIQQNILLSGILIAAVAVAMVRFHAYLFLRSFLEHKEASRHIEALTRAVNRMSGISSVIAVAVVAAVLAWVYPA
ncbi:MULTISPECIES: hypothetical protein [Pseudomonas]|uniref:Uncharacterized protein n=1 Tax=Pseudomonas fluorescens TaxID=294 RepID=A0A166QQ60_PSEFL|nr:MULTISPECIES: hypothetical protein [Pseudomonas]KZN20671.1 hypothetical protein A1D17_03785 [Pseudomonas fluorescens]